MIKQLNEKLETLLEYKVEGIIISDNDNYNILDEKKKPMLEKPYRSLKQLLLDLAKYV